MSKWEQEENVQLNSSQSAISYVDKQDTSLVTDVCRNHDHFSGATKAYLMDMFIFILFVGKKITVCMGKNILNLGNQVIFVKWSNFVP